jgi:hypothetical protein
MMEATCSSEMSVLTGATQLLIPENGNLQRLKGFENRMQRRLFVPRRDEAMGGRTKVRNEEFRN